MDNKDIFPEQISQGTLKANPEWEPLRDVLRQVQTEIRTQELEAVKKVAVVRAKEEFCKEWAVDNLVELYSFTALASFLFVSIPLIIINAVFGAVFGLNLPWLWLFLAPPMLITPVVYFSSSRAIKNRAEKIVQDKGISLDTNEALRQSALSSASDEIRPALSDAFDDAFIIMDQLKASEDSDPAIAQAMQGLRQTIGGMIISGAIVKRIDEYLKTRPDHVKRALTREGEMGEEVNLCRRLVSDRLNILKSIEQARQDVSLLRGSLLQIQNHALSEGMRTTQSDLQNAIQMTQAHAEALNEINESVLASLYI